MNRHVGHSARADAIVVRPARGVRSKPECSPTPRVSAHAHGRAEGAMCGACGKVAATNSRGPASGGRWIVWRRRAQSDVLRFVLHSVACATCVRGTPSGPTVCLGPRTWRHFRVFPAQSSRQSAGDRRHLSFCLRSCRIAETCGLARIALGVSAAFKSSSPPAAHVLPLRHGYGRATRAYTIRAVR